jgi:hypothetical protein
MVRRTLLTLARPVLFVAVLLAVGVAQEGRPPEAEAARRPLSVVLVIDGSGSMTRTDPQGIRKAAAQALVTLLGPDDRVAVVEFNQNARVRSGWVSASDQAALLARLATVSSGEGATDFRDALQKAGELLAGQGGGRRKVVVLLTDGIMECPPDPAEQNPIARGDIFNSILPDMKRQEAEIYTVGLSSEADEPFLHEAASLTSLRLQESHSFHVERAADLIGTFASLVQYWTDFMVLRAERIVGGQVVRGYIDQYVSEPQLVAVGDVSNLTVGDAAAVPGTVPILRVYPLKGVHVPGTTIASLSSGECGILWVGRSSLRLEATGLKPRYGLGELVDVTARPRTGAGTPRLTNPRVEARFTLPGGGSVVEPLSPAGDGFRLRYSPSDTGRYELQLVLNAQDASGNDIFPRPTLTYQFQVTPDFYVVPSVLSYGRPRGGRTVIRDIEVHYGLPSPTRVDIAGSVQWSGNRHWKAGDALPAIDSASVEVSPGTVVKQPIALRLPGNTFWRNGGHYRGTIRVSAAGQTRDVEFWVHLETWWEFWRRIVVVVIILGALVLGYFIYIFARLPLPHGVIHTKAPGGAVVPPVRLGRLRRGFATKWLSPKRNLVGIARARAELTYPRLAVGLRADLVFLRMWSGRTDVYLWNRSIEAEGMNISVGRLGRAPVCLRPGRKARIRHLDEFQIGEYGFRYENAVKGG